MRDAPGVAPVDALTALAASAELSCCELDQSASIIHRWLRQHWPHDAVTITANGSREPLSQWTSPAFELPDGDGLVGRPTPCVRSAARVVAASALRPGRA